MRLGQNFLADPNLLDAIVRDAELEPGDVALEIGGGEGVLTERIAERVAHVHVVELDDELADGLQELAERAGNVSVVRGDAMRLDLAAIEPAPTTVPSNLPYSVATPVLLRTIAELPGVARWTVMVQREIADRLRAEPGTSAYGSPSVRRAAGLRGGADPDREPGGVSAAAAGGLGARAASARRPRSGGGCGAARARVLRPPAKAARELAGAGGRAVAPGGAGGPRGAGPRARRAR